MLLNGEPCKDPVDLPSFRSYLRGYDNKSKRRTDDLVLGIQRALDSIEVMPNPARPNADAVDVSDASVLVGFHIHKVHDKLVDIPIMDPKFTWPRYVIEGITSYAEFHLKDLRDLALTPAAPPHVAGYQNALESLIKDVNSGYKHRLERSRIESQIAKRRFDRARLDEFPSVPRLQHAVREGYIVLGKVNQHYKSTGRMTSRMWGAANSSLSGGIHFDTFCGRRHEWEHAKFAVIIDVLKKHQTWFPTDDHKMRRVYGEIAKKITPGLFVAFDIYATFPRPDDCETFLVPVQSAAGGALSLLSHQATFCRRHLADCEGIPYLTNINRKWWHTDMMRLTRDMESLKELFCVLDAHSKEVQGTHYILRSAADDVRLADELIKAKLGETVAFPSDEEIELYCNAHPALAAKLDKICGAQREGADQDDASSDAGANIESDDDSEPLEPWAMGHLFGVEPDKALSALQDGSVDDATPSTSHTSNAMPLAVEASVVPLPSAVVGDDSADWTPALFDRPVQRCSGVYRTKANIHQNKLDLYEVYSDPNAAGARVAMSDKAKAWITSQVLQWREKYQRPDEVPFPTEWYRRVANWMARSQPCWACVCARCDVRVNLCAVRHLVFLRMCAVVPLGWRTFRRS